MENQQKISLIEKNKDFELKIDDTLVKNIVKYEVSSNSELITLKIELSLVKDNFTFKVEH